MLTICLISEDVIEYRPRDAYIRSVRANKYTSTTHLSNKFWAETHFKGFVYASCHHVMRIYVLSDQTNILPQRTCRTSFGQKPILKDLFMLHVTT